MPEDKDFIITVPRIPFFLLNKTEKGELGEKFIELCLYQLELKLGIDFRTYPRTESYQKRESPDFSDEVGGKHKTFEIEAKNLSLTSGVNQAWIKQNVPSYWFEKNGFQKVLVIFGGDIEPDVPEYLRNEEFHYIPYEKPVEAKDYRDLVWWLKDKLLDVPSIRRRAIVALNREYRSSPLSSLLKLYLPFDDKLFLTLNYDTSKSCYVLRSFPNREWASQEEFYKCDSLGIDGIHQWEVKLEELNKSA